ncbi:MAG TPA: aminoglycoside phosphotransferase family protein [Acidimicrobiales bacterium]|nr:aminoglycoside phosphotransferase family protein [Acidimicrobiales bacterium]
MTALPEGPDEVAALATLVLGGPADSITRVASFAGNRVFRLEGGTDAVYLKLGAQRDVAREHHALALAASCSVPVPAVVWFDLEQRSSPHAGVALAELAGEPLELDAPADPTTELAALLARWHAIPLRGFGLADPVGGELRGEDTSWHGSLLRRAALARDAVRAGLVAGDLIERVVRNVEGHAHLTRLEGGRLLHGDFHPRHVYADASGITGIIDWGDATVGDPDYDLARIVHASFFLGGFDDAARRLGPFLGGPDATPAERAAKLLLYAAVFVCWCMSGELEGGAPAPRWWPAQERVLGRLLDHFDRAVASDRGHSS